MIETVLFQIPDPVRNRFRIWVIEDYLLFGAWDLVLLILQCPRRDAPSHGVSLYKSRVSCP
jgi:hypothetical protein